MNIIQHHAPIDFEALFKQSEEATIGIDGRDLETFAVKADEIHSFFGSAEGEDRIDNAFEEAIGSDEAMEIVCRSKAFLLIVRYNPDCERHLMMGEISAVKNFVAGLPEGSDTVWSMMQDTALGNKVEIVLLCNIKL